MEISKAILEELKKYNQINRYIVEQDAPEVGDVPPPPPPPAGDAPEAVVGETEPTTPPAGETEPQPVDVASDPDVEKVGEEEEESGSEELEITDLVKSQKNIETKQEDYFNNLFSQLSNLEKKII